MGNFKQFLKEAKQIPELHNSVWEHPEDGTAHIEKDNEGYHGTTDKYDFHEKTKEKMHAKLKHWGFKHIGYD